MRRRRRGGWGDEASTVNGQRSTGPLFHPPRPVALGGAVFQDPRARRGGGRRRQGGAQRGEGEAVEAGPAGGAAPAAPPRPLRARGHSGRAGPPARLRRARRDALPGRQSRPSGPGAPRGAAPPRGADGRWTAGGPADEGGETGERQLEKASTVTDGKTEGRKDGRLGTNPLSVFPSFRRSVYWRL